MQSGDWPYPYHRQKLLKGSVSLCSCAYTCTVCVLICSGNKELCGQDNSHFIPSTWVKRTLNFSVGQLLKPPSIKVRLAFSKPMLLCLLAVHTASFPLSCTSSQPWDRYSLSDLVTFQPFYAKTTLPELKWLYIIIG